MALPPPDPASQSVRFDSFSGLKNTVDPEDLTAKELSRAQNIDLDDAGRAHRRRGRTLRVAGVFHSVFTSPDKAYTFAIKDGSLVQVLPNWSTREILAGFSAEPVCYEVVGPTLYLCSKTNSAQVDLATMIPSPWGLVASPSYQPGLKPGPADFWYSPVVNPDVAGGLGSVGGRLFGAPPLGTSIAYYKGRLYVAQGRTLWATELFLYNYVDKNKGYKLFESEITCLGVVEDGLYVGTQDGLYFMSGTFHEAVRTMRARGGVLRGSMVQVPGELVSPEARIRPDVPIETTEAVACVTTNGIVVGLASGKIYNLTETTYIFPTAQAAAPLYRNQDGVHTLVAAMDSGGGPATSTARFGDYASAEVIRYVGTPGQPGTKSTMVLPKSVP